VVWTRRAAVRESVALNPSPITTCIRPRIRRWKERRSPSEAPPVSCVRTRSLCCRYERIRLEERIGDTRCAVARRIVEEVAIYYHLDRGAPEAAKVVDP
jgi:hypothetical protein